MNQFWFLNQIEQYRRAEVTIDLGENSSACGKSGNQDLLEQAIGESALTETFDLGYLLESYQYDEHT